MDKTITYHMPFAKVDESKRIVSGFATLNNVDRQKDIVTTEASVRAFKAFRGNIREQHSKIAAGKMISFGVEQFFDKISNNVYDGIFVRAYVSRGAPETWEKVLDGTLTGFSIAGDITEWETISDENGGKVRVVKEYELSELSLVDNPANTLANVTSIEKAHDFFTNIAETIDEKELSSMKITKSDAPADGGEGIVATESSVVVEEVAPAELVAEVIELPKATLADETLGESVENPEAGSADADVLAEAIKGINSLIEDTNAKTADAFNLIVEQLKEMRSAVEGATVKVDSVQEDLVGVKSAVSSFDKRVASVEADTAVRKSGDLGEVAQVTKVEKSLWGGAFLTADL
jgi:hypothetical protein